MVCMHCVQNLWTNFRMIESMDGKLHKTLFLAMRRSEE